MQRRIHFFAGQLVHYQSSLTGTTTEPSDLQGVFNVIDSLPWDKSRAVNAYDPDADGHVAVKVVRFGSNRVFGQLARSRSSALPLIDRHGQIEPLRLDVDESLFEASHFGIFWDRHHCILALEYNQHAPRHKRLGQYLKNKLFGHGSVFLDTAIFTPMVKREPLERMLEHEELGMIRLAFHRTLADEIAETEEDSDLVRALQIVADAAPELDVIEFVLKASSADKRARRGSRPSWLRQLARIVRNHADRILSAKVEMYPSDGNELIDINLLSDKFVHSILVPVQEDRTIDSMAMLKNIESLYDTNINELSSGDGLGPLQPDQGETKYELPD